MHMMVRAMLVCWCKAVRCKGWSNIAACAACVCLPYAAGEVLPECNFDLVTLLGRQVALHRSLASALRGSYVLWQGCGNHRWLQELMRGHDAADPFLMA